MDSVKNTELKTVSRLEDDMEEREMKLHFTRNHFKGPMAGQVTTGTIRFTDKEKAFDWRLEMDRKQETNGYWITITLVEAE